MSPLWVVAVPAAGAVAVLFGGRLRAPFLSSVLGGVTWVLGLVVALPALGSDQLQTYAHASVPTGTTEVTLALGVDGLAAAGVLLATSVAFAVLVYSVAYLAEDPRYPSYASIVLIFTAAMNTVVLADDFFVMLVGWEVMGACSYFLISHHWERQDARAGAVKAFVMTRLGDVGLLFGIFVLGLAVGSFRISEVNAAAVAGDLSTTQATVGMLLILCGVVGKSSQFPLHTWLPDAMPGPTPISALIHAATMVAAGVYLIARLFDVLAVSAAAQAVLAVIAAITMVLSAFFALAQDDLKRVLAWSTVSQLAYMFGALAVGGYGAAVFHLLSHGAFKALLFLCAGSVAHATGTTSMARLGGLHRRMPVTSVTMLVGMAALVGLPPLVGFFSKDAVLGAYSDAALHDVTWTGWLVFCAGLVTMLATAAYATRAWVLVFTGPSPEGGRVPREAPMLMRGPLLVLGGLTAVGGVLTLAPQVLEPGATVGELFHPWLAMPAAVAVMVVVLLTYAEAWRAEDRDPSGVLGRWRPVLAREAGFDPAYDRLFVVPTHWSAQGVVAADRDVVEPYVRGSVSAVRGAGAALRWAQNGNVQVYLTVVVVGAVAMAVVVGAVVA
ncbi:MAG: NADH-quinone oxidoreductase subunit L [Propionibacteriales bacterium]|nr:NADH-quinone oxidoreductase subunit L [Propionibacteriales bacterium]